MNKRDEQGWLQPSCLGVVSFPGTVVVFLSVVCFIFPCRLNAEVKEQRRERPRKGKRTGNEEEQWLAGRFSERPGSV